MIGFNEAEARAPRMPRAGATERVASVSRFNEAEARAPRMPGRGDQATDATRRLQ